MHVHLIAMGSLGDTLPFVHIGRALLERGHQATLLGNEHYEDLITREGLGFHSILSRERYANFVERRKSGDQFASLLDMAHLMIEQVEPVYEYLKSRYVPGETVVCAQAYAVGARIAQETMGIPLATAHLQPLWLRSAYDMPSTPRWLRPIVGPGVQRLFDFFFDNSVGKDIMAFRAKLGLPREKRFMRTWWNSPDCVLGLFPKWYSPAQRDWPRNVALPGFPLPASTDPDFDLGRVSAFLGAGAPPLVFTQSTIASESRPFFETSIEIARRLQSRAMFLSPHRDTLPDVLPEGMSHFPYAPLDQVLPHARAHIHHGGVGTIAHSLKAGIPQITVAGIFDQPDNAARLVPLGVSLNIKPKHFSADYVAPRLDKLLSSPKVAAKCRDFADRMHQMDPLEEICQLLSRLVTQPVIHPPGGSRPSRPRLTKYAPRAPL